MAREEQDKLWNELSEENKTHYREQYSEQKTMSESGVPQLLEELFGSHNLQPTLTYEDICEELKNNREGCFPEMRTYTGNEKILIHHYDEKGVFSKQLKKLLAINRLLNVAKFLNKNEDGSGWVPDWKDWGYKPSESKWYFLICDGEILIKRDDISCSAPVYFRTEEIARQVVQILGEDVIRTALTTDY